MAGPVPLEPISGLTFDGVDLQREDGRLYLQLRQGAYEPPEVRGEDVLIPYRDGLEPRPRRPERRILLLVGEVRGDGENTLARQQDYEQQMLVLQQLFSTYRMPAALEATYPSGTVRTIDARPMNMVPVPQVLGELCQLSVQLDSVVPEWSEASS